MATSKLKKILLIFTAFLSIQSAFVGPVDCAGIGVDISVEAELYVRQFCETLVSELLIDETFNNCFISQFNVDLWIQIGLAIGKNLCDRYGFDLALIISLQECMQKMKPGCGKEEYARAIVDCIKLYCSSVVHATNVFSLTTEFLNCIRFAISSCINVGFNLGAGIDIGGGLAVSAGGSAGVTVGAGGSAGINIGAGVNAGLNADIAGGAGINVGVDGSAGLNAAVVGGAGVNVGAGLIAGATVGAGASVDVNVASGIEAKLEVVGNLIVGSLDLVITAGLELDLSSCEDDKKDFKEKLTEQLLLNKGFKYIFSDIIPIASLRTLLQAISRYLHYAFCLPPTVFLPLETVILSLICDQSLSVQAYAEVISEIIATILSETKLLVKDAVVLQVAIAQTAISTGINSFTKLTYNSEVGVSIRTSRNSIFSPFAPLSKLVYVGFDNLPVVLPPVIRTARTSSFARRFMKILYYNLISSNKFTESFSLGVASIKYKALSISLGRFMAEAFGSENSSVFTQLYETHFLRIVGQVNYKIYAKFISVATAKALDSLGYFVSGRATFQASLATNAVLRAVIRVHRKSTCTDIAIYPAVIGLPSFIPLSGVPIPDCILNADIKFNLNLDLFASIGIDIGVDVKVGADVNVDVDAKVDADVKVGADVDVNANVDVSAGVDADIDLDLLDSDMKAMLGVGLSANVGAELSGNVDAELSAKVDAGLSAEVSADVSAGGKADSSASASADGQISIIKVIGPMLANKYYQCTSIYTAISIVGVSKVSILIAQAVAQDMGFVAGAAFLKTYNAVCSKLIDRSFASSVVALAAATSSALIASGTLQVSINVQELDDLTSYITTSFASLIATSLECEFMENESWTNSYQPDCYDPVLVACNCY